MFLMLGQVQRMATKIIRGLATSQIRGSPERQMQYTRTLKFDDHPLSDVTMSEMKILPTPTILSESKK